MTHRCARTLVVRAAMMLLLFQAVATAFVCHNAPTLTSGLELAQRPAGVCNLQVYGPAFGKKSGKAPVNHSHDGPVQQCPVCQGLTGHFLAILAAEAPGCALDQGAQSYLAALVDLPSGAETSRTNNRGPPVLPV